MKKLVAIQHCGSVGGSGIGLLSVLNMMRTKYEIVIYCASYPADLANHYKKNGYDVKLVRYIPGFAYHSGGPSAVDIDFLGPALKIAHVKEEWSRILLSEMPDYVLVNSMVLGWMWEPIAASNALGICHVREVLPNRWDPRAKKMLRDLEHFGAVWFISEHERDFFNLKHPKTAVIRDCLDSAPNPAGMISTVSNSGSFHVLYVGGLSKLKGIHTLLKSIEYLDEGIVVDIAGYIPADSKFKPNVYAHFGFLKNLLMRMKNLSKRRMLKTLETVYSKRAGSINLIGHRNDLSELYRNCDVLVFPSYKPHQSRPAFEAGFFGKPVIISRFEHTNENVLDGQNGLTFSPNNPLSLANAINSLCNNRSLCRKLGESNRENSIEKHTSQAVQAMLDEFWNGFTE